MGRTSLAVTAWFSWYLYFENGHGENNRFVTHILEAEGGWLTRRCIHESGRPGLSLSLVQVSFVSSSPSERAYQ